MKSSVRDRVVACAWEEFSGASYSGASLARISRAAGSTKPMIYYYFASKEGLYGALVDRLQGTLDVLFEVGNEAGGIERLLQRHLQWARERPLEHALFARLLGLAGLYCEGPELAASEAIYNRLRQLGRRLLASQGIAANGPGIECLLGAMQGSIRLGAADLAELNLAELARQVERALDTTQG